MPSSVHRITTPIVRDRRAAARGARTRVLKDASTTRKEEGTLPTSPITYTKKSRLLSRTKATAIGARREILLYGLDEQKKEATLSLFRNLLRECTYLPDPAARAYWHLHIRNRWRTYCPRKGGGKWWEEPHDVRVKSKIPDRFRLPVILEEASQLLAVLCRANGGEVGPLKKVLEHTYGRAGKRRHELIAAISSQDIPDDQEAVKTLAAASAEQQDAGKPKEIPGTLKAIMLAQRGQKRQALSRAPMKSLEPDIPEKNSWGRPLPVNRRRNMATKWRAKAMESILPPLPTTEWERLRGLVTGQLPWSRPPRRRGPISAELANLYNKESYSRESHHLTPRYMRRMWAKIYVQCPIMIWNAESKKWAVQWGKTGNTIITRAVRKPDAGDDMFYSGVDDEGRRFKLRL
ncbi:hypothetical protein MMC13_008402 [Lambiella insularis]|nr:hypothetical protein [Lambiella insularis]